MKYGLQPVPQDERIYNKPDETGFVPSIKAYFDNAATSITNAKTCIYCEYHGGLEYFDGNVCLTCGQL